MFKNILCPVDLMPKSKMALGKALTLAHHFDSKVTILNVNENFSSKKEMIMSRVSVSQLQNEFKKVALSAKEDMKKLVKDLDPELIKCEYILRDGKAPEVINKISSEKEIDLVVMGTNGRDSIGDMLLGSTAEQVIKNLKCSVLIVPIGS